MSTQAKAFIAITASIGLLVLCTALWNWHCDDLLRFCCYLGIALVASGLKVQLPGIDGTMSVNFLFILLGILELSLPETLVIGCTSALLQCVWRTRQGASPAKIAFNVLSMMANAIGISYFTYHRLTSVWGTQNATLLLAFAAFIYFLANTLPVSVIIGLTEAKSARQVWRECYFWSFPFYLLGAAII